MIEIARTLRVLAGGLVVGAIGVTVFAGATASADPLQPAPQPAPAVPAAPVVPPVPAAPAQGAPQNVMAVPGQAPNNRLLATPNAANPVAPAPAAVTPAAPMPPTSAPAVSGTIREYLQSKGVKLEAQKPQGLKALDITLPVPLAGLRSPIPTCPTRSR